MTHFLVVHKITHIIIFSVFLYILPKIDMLITNNIHYYCLQRNDMNKTIT